MIKIISKAKETSQHFCNKRDLNQKKLLSKPESSIRPQQTSH